MPINVTYRGLTMEYPTKEEFVDDTETPMSRLITNGTTALMKQIEEDSREYREIYRDVPFYRAQVSNSFTKTLGFAWDHNELVDPIQYYIQVEYIAGDKIYVVSGENIEPEEFGHIQKAVAWLNTKHEVGVFFSLTHLSEGEGEEIFDPKYYPNMIDYTDSGEERLLVKSWKVS